MLWPVAVIEFTAAVFVCIIYSFILIDLDPGFNNCQSKVENVYLEEITPQLSLLICLLLLVISHSEILIKMCFQQPYVIHCLEICLFTDAIPPEFNCLIDMTSSIIPQVTKRNTQTIIWMLKHHWKKAQNKPLWHAPSMSFPTHCVYKSALLMSTGNC